MKNSTKPQTQDDAAWMATLTGHQVRIKTYGKETDNRITIIEYIEPPGSTPPVFTRHEFVEVFCVLRGTLTFKFLGEEAFEATAGTFVTAPSWKPHSFWNRTSEPAHILLVCSPAGLDQFFIESAALLKRLPVESTDPARLAAAMKELRDKFGLEHVGEPPKA